MWCLWDSNSLCDVAAVGYMDLWLDETNVDVTNGQNKTNGALIIAIAFNGQQSTMIPPCTQHAT